MAGDDRRDADLVGPLFYLVEHRALLAHAPALAGGGDISVVTQDGAAFVAELLPRRAGQGFQLVVAQLDRRDALVGDLGRARIAVREGQLVDGRSAGKAAERAWPVMPLDGDVA